MHVALPQLAQVYGPIYRILFGRFPVIVVSDPDMVKEVRRSCNFFFKCETSTRRAILGIARQFGQCAVCARCSGVLLPMPSRLACGQTAFMLIACGKSCCMRIRFAACRCACPSSCRTTTVNITWCASAAAVSLPIVQALPLCGLENRFLVIPKAELRCCCCRCPSMAHTAAVAIVQTDNDHAYLELTALVT